jgi:hypothetical protein
VMTDSWNCLITQGLPIFKLPSQITVRSQLH